MGERVKAYYNDNDPFVAQWLRNLVSAGMITAGDVDERSIEDVNADELEGYNQCHFFAGIAGWDIALSLAGWEDNVWTGSCPCQPFSNAGRGMGAEDERHIWPAFFRLIAERRPSTVFGEQVASKDGRTWLSAVRHDLEAIDYAVGAADLCAASVGSPHIRQRLFWMANANFVEWRSGESGHEKDRQETKHRSRMGNSYISKKERLRPFSIQVESEQETDGPGDATPWSECEFIPCADGRTRPVKHGIYPLADGIPGRVGILRGYGNAIVPQVAAEFISAFMECRP